MVELSEAFQEVQKAFDRIDDYLSNKAKGIVAERDNGLYEWTLYYDGIFKLETCLKAGQREFTEPKPITFGEAWQFYHRPMTERLITFPNCQKPEPFKAIQQHSIVRFRHV